MWCHGIDMVDKNACRDDDAGEDKGHSYVVLWVAELLSSGPL